MFRLIQLNHSSIMMLIEKEIRKTKQKPNYAKHCKYYSEQFSEPSIGTV